MSDADKDIRAVIVTKEKISAAEYLDLAKNDSPSIKRVSFVPPRIGDKGFGSFEVEYRNPKLVPLFK